MITSLCQYASACPDWLRTMTMDGMKHFLESSTAIKSILENSLVYPGAGTDWSPIRQTIGVNHSYLYFDFMFSNDNQEDLPSIPQLLHHCAPLGEEAEGSHCVDVLQFDTHLLIRNNSPLVQPPDSWKDLQQKHEGCWAVYELKSGERISLLYLMVEAINGLAELYVPNRISPRIFVQHDQIMGHCWGSFAPPYNRLIRTHGLRWPEFLIVGQERERIGPPDAYRTLCYDQALESMFSNVHEIKIYAEDDVKPTASSFLRIPTAATEQYSEFNHSLIARVVELTVPCSDNGIRFVRTERLDKITSILLGSDFVLMQALPLASIYRHRNFDDKHSIVVLSAHVDSAYDKFWAKVVDSEIHGTFDNSACNAVLVEMMLQGRIPEQTLVVFTGDEEGESTGVDQTIAWLGTHDAIWQKLELIISLDLTEEFYVWQHFTVENFCIEEDNANSVLKFATEAKLQFYISTLLPKVAYIQEAEADDTWQYEEYDFNCFSFCLPCRPIGSDMHDDDGVSIMAKSLSIYMDALSLLIKGIQSDFNRKEEQAAQVRSRALTVVQRANTHIWNAIRRNDEKAIVALLAKGVDIKAVSPNGNTMEQFAELCGHPNIVKLIRRRQIQG